MNLWLSAAWKISCCDFVTEPEWIERMMQFMTDGIMKRFDDLEEQGLLSLRQ